MAVDEEYGIDDDGPVLLEDSDEPFEVSQTGITLTQNFQQQLEVTIEPLHDSDCYKADILSSCEFLSKCL